MSTALKRTTVGLAAIGLVAVLPAGASARQSRDRDHDGLSARAEHRLGTNPRRADTDRDGIKDGREVRIGTNPLKADTDRDGIRDGNEVRAGSSPTKADTDSDGLDDSYEYGDDGDAVEVEGTVTAVGSNSVTIAGEKGSSVVVQVTDSTRFRVADTNGDGSMNLADIRVGDEVEAHTQATADGTVALSIEAEGSDDSPGDDDSGDDDGGNDD